MEAHIGRAAAPITSSPSFGCSRGIARMIDGRANYCFTELVDILLTPLLSPGTSASAIGL
ncbi:hypothetical protein Syun_017185 [Stephania yunnanensis]|uniref:Uncharacterized protein n=1 Tax=Stephania yunnanensis TaxID=152371 RepID=A0AAP0J8Q0_9MAGN